MLTASPNTCATNAQDAATLDSDGIGISAGPHSARGISYPTSSVQVSSPLYKLHPTQRLGKYDTASTIINASAAIEYHSSGRQTQLWTTSFQPSKSLVAVPHNEALPWTWWSLCTRCGTALPWHAMLPFLQCCPQEPPSSQWSESSPSLDRRPQPSIVLDHLENVPQTSLVRWWFPHHSSASQALASACHSCAPPSLQSHWWWWSQSLRFSPIPTTSKPLFLMPKVLGCWAAFRFATLRYTKACHPNQKWSEYSVAEVSPPLACRQYLLPVVACHLRCQA